jgi:hypothetical protein
MGFFIPDFKGRSGIITSPRQVPIVGLDDLMVDKDA